MERFRWQAAALLVAMAALFLSGCASKPERRDRTLTPGYVVAESSGQPWGRNLRARGAKSVEPGIEFTVYVDQSQLPSTAFNMRFVAYAGEIVWNEEGSDLLLPMERASGGAFGTGGTVNFDGDTTFSVSQSSTPLQIRAKMTTTANAGGYVILGRGTSGGNVYTMAYHYSLE